MPKPDINDVILTLYQAATEPDRWADALQQVSDFVGGCAAAMEFIALPSTNVQVAASYGYDVEGIVSAVGTELGEVDPWWRCVEMEPHSDFHVGSKYVPAKDVRKTPFYNEGLRPFESDWRDTMALLVPISHGSTGLFSVYRHGNEDDFGYAEIQRMRALKPHVMQAMEICNRLGGQQLREALNDRMRTERGDAVLFVDIHGAVTYANPLAEAFLQSPVGPMTTRAGQVQLRNAKANRQFQRALWNCLACLDLNRSPGGEAVVWQHEGKRYSACLTPHLQRVLTAPLEAEGKAPAVAIVIRGFHPDSKAIAARVQQAFQLTAAETRILERFLDGLSMQDICDATGVTMNTLKSQCRSIYRKTETVNQAALIRMSLTAFSA